MQPYALEPGVHATPRALAERLCRRLLAEAGDSPRPAVFDPACGNGELLLAAWRVGRALGRPPVALHGVELDRDRADKAQRRLARAVSSGTSVRVIQADALDPRTVWPAGTLVAANPPWVSFSGRQAEPRERSTEPGAGWPSLHGAFLERIAAHVFACGTRAAVLLPAAVCDLEGYGAVRRAVTRSTHLVAPPLDLGERAFPGVIQPSVLIELRSRVGRTAGSVAPWGSLGAAERELLSSLERFPRLPARSFGDPGVHTGNCARELVLPGPVAGLPPLRAGRDLLPYRLGPPRLALDTRIQASTQRRFRSGSLERYRAVPILLRQTADRPVAALHTDPGHFRNSLLACTPPPGLDPAFVVAVLNGRLCRAWHRLSFRDARQRSFPQVKVSHLRTAPFPFVRRRDAPAIHDEVAQAVRSLLEGTDLDPLQIDRLEARVTEAYGLDERLVARLVSASAAVAPRGPG